MKTFITKKIPEIAEKVLLNEGFDVDVYKQNKLISKQHLMNRSKDVDAIICLLTNIIDQEIISNFTKCKVISNVAVGYNNIDIRYAKSRGIWVTNTPDILTDATADLAMALLLSAARRFPEGEEMMRSYSYKGWDTKLLRGIELKGKILGIVGAGRIGQATARRAKGFGIEIIYFDSSKKVTFEKELNAKRVTLNTLLKKSDLISIHLPLNKDTYHILNKNNMSLLKPSSVLVNTARGEIIDEKILIKMLKSKRIFAAGLDVYENEPNFNKDFLKLKNVVLLPHIGSSTFETRDAMAKLAARNVVNVLKGKKPITPVF
jgi:glyoxylate reductase